jgi:uncharacterized protein YkwD
MSLNHSIKTLCLSLFFSLILWASAHGQAPDRLNTAAGASYMKPSEKEMIREINLLRSNPKGYMVYVDQFVEDSKDIPEIIGKSQKNYSLTMYYESLDGVKKLVRIDTAWLNEPADQAYAVASLRKDLSSMKPLSILQPDKGIYEAVKSYALDEGRHGWTLSHIGSDGSAPWDRITKHSPGMKNGNENIASRFPEPTVREIVILLLIDTGIAGFGHRYNLLDPDWTHVACYDAGLQDGMYRWVQNFGMAR